MPYVGVAIQSIKEHVNPDRFYDIYILHTDLKEESQILLEGMTADHVRVSCIDVSEKIKGIPFYDKDHYSLAMWYRLFIPDLFYGYDKVLYLDTDIVAESDVAELFDTDLKECWLGACRSWTTELYEYAENTLNLVGETYFNSGVLLLNIPKLRENDLTAKCLKLVNPDKKYMYPDQDILNIVCQNQVHFLPGFYNCGWYHLNRETAPWYDKWYTQVYKKAKILHYSSDKKPWNNPKKRLADRWWMYARLSPFYETVLWENLPKSHSSAVSQSGVIVLNKKPLMAEKEKFYSDMKQFVKGSFKCLFSFGKKKKKCQAELGKLLTDMLKKV